MHVHNIANGLYCTHRWIPLLVFSFGALLLMCVSVCDCVCMHVAAVLRFSACSLVFPPFLIHSLTRCVCLCVCFIRKFTSIANLFGMWNSSVALLYMHCFFLFLYFEPKWYNGIFSSFILVELALFFFRSVFLSISACFVLCLYIFVFFSCTSESSKCKANTVHMNRQHTNHTECIWITHTRSNVLWMHMDKAIRKQKHKIPFNSIIYLMACPIDFDATRFKMDRPSGEETEWGPAENVCVCVFFLSKKGDNNKKHLTRQKKTHANTKWYRPNEMFALYYGQLSTHLWAFICPFSPFACTYGVNTNQINQVPLKQQQLSSAATKQCN